MVEYEKRYILSVFRKLGGNNDSVSAGLFCLVQGLISS